jgi:ABC-type nitrate/sulfonate/bicarbonate transport system ATPase subunit
MTTYEKHEVVLDIQNVSLSFGSKLILRDISTTVYNIVRPDCLQGQVICFLGPSGIGKTQLSRVIAGLQAPTSGRVLVPDRPVRAGMVGMVPQRYPLFQFATVREQLVIAGRQAGLGPQAVWERADPLVDEFGLRTYLDMYPRALSGGTQQRVAIVRQLMCSDHYIVMDEPFSGLDLIMKRRACALISRIANLDELNTIIVVTHDITEGMSVADTVWLMGLEPDPDQPDTFLPGARFVEQYDLAAAGLCWRPNITSDPEFLAFVAHVKERFATLAP